MSLVSRWRPGYTHLFFEFGVRFLSLNELKNDMEGASQDKGKEETETSKVNIALRAWIEM